MEQKLIRGHEARTKVILFHALVTNGVHRNRNRTRNESHHPNLCDVPHLLVAFTRSVGVISRVFIKGEGKRRKKNKSKG